MCVLKTSVSGSVSLRGSAPGARAWANFFLLIRRGRYLFYIDQEAQYPGGGEPGDGALVSGSRGVDLRV